MKRLALLVALLVTCICSPALATPPATPPSSGGAGGAYTTWTQDTDADGFDLTELGDIESLKPTPANDPIKWRQWGFGDLLWDFGSGNSGYSFTGLAVDNVFEINYNILGGQIHNPYNPSFGMTLESNYGDTSTEGFGGPGGGTWWEWHLAPQNNSTPVTVASAVGFSDTPGDYDRISVQKPDGTVAAVGRVSDITGSVITVSWIQSADNTQKPTAGDTFESEITSTLSGVSGTFNLASRLWVSSSASCAGLSDSNHAALLVPIDVGPPLEALVSFGDRDAVASGNCVQQALSGATGTLGAVTSNATTTISSLGTNAADHFRWFTSVGNYQDGTAKLEIYTSDEAREAFRPAIKTTWGLTEQQIAGRGVYILSDGVGTDGNATTSQFRVGGAGELVDSEMYGKFSIYRGTAGAPGFIDINLADDVVGRTHWLPDESGVVALWIANGSNPTLLTGAPNGALVTDQSCLRANGTSGSGQTSVRIQDSDSGCILEDNFRGVSTDYAMTVDNIIASDTMRLPNGAAPGATCDVGEIFIDTDETDDTNCTTTNDNSLCLCTAANTWTAFENN